MYFILTRSWLTKSRFIFILFIILFSDIDVQAQLIQSQRFEIQLYSEGEHVEIIPCGDHGLFLYKRLEGGKEDEIQVIRLDTTFQQKWSGFIPVDNDYHIMGQKAYNKKLFLLLRYRDYSKNDFIVLIIDDEDGSFTKYTIRGFIPITPSEFQTTDNAIIIGGYYNQVPIVIYFSLSKLSSKVLPGLFNESGELTQVKTYPDGSFDVLISAQSINKQRTIWIKNYDSEGNLYRNYALNPGDKNLIFGRSLKTDNAMQLVAGVYGNRNAEFSRGIFIASIDLSGRQQIRYYNFGDLKNFFKYMKAKREKRVKDRIERRKIKGKKIRLNYRFLVHELFPYQNKYILLGEAFYPRYSNTERGFSTTFFSPGYSSNAIMRNGRVFEGFIYTHAVVMGFDAKANLLWDNSFEINDVKTLTLEQFVKLEVQEDKIALLYLFENKLRTKIIKDDQVLEGKTVDPIRQQSVRDVVIKNDPNEGKLEHWYKDYLYASGVQEIVNPDKGKQKRKVFYINKIQHAK
jgi:hypothetical protein